MHSLAYIEISLRLSFEKAVTILMVKYHVKISILNLRKHVTVRNDCNPRPWFRYTDTI